MSSLKFNIPIERIFKANKHRVVFFSFSERNINTLQVEIRYFAHRVLRLRRSLTVIWEIYSSSFCYKNVLYFFNSNGVGEDKFTQE